jgi:1-acyl-sn-glycerol-3-phosphate acyltransferase
VPGGGPPPRLRGREDAALSSTPATRPHTRPRGADLNYLWMPALMRLLCGALLGDAIDVMGIERVPLRGGLLVVSNHVGFIDPAFTGAYLPRRDLYFMARSEYFRHPVSRFFIVGYHGFPVVRGTADRAALRQALNLLAAGHGVVMYAEGHRSPDGRLQRPHPGAGFLARSAAVPVLPIAVWGTERVIPLGARWPRRAPVHLHVGRAEPVPVADAEGRRLSNQDIADLLMRRVAALLPPSRLGVFDGVRDVSAVPPPAA